VSLALAVASTVLASRQISRAGEPFLPLVATGTGAFFSLVIAGQWLTQLLIPPCTHLP
jgi:hypothetical protein